MALVAARVRERVFTAGGLSSAVLDQVLAAGASRGTRGAVAADFLELGLVSDLAINLWGLRGLLRWVGVAVSVVCGAETVAFALGVAAGISTLGAAAAVSTLGTAGGGMGTLGAGAGSSRARSKRCWMVVATGRGGSAGRGGLLGASTLGSGWYT